MTIVTTQGRSVDHLTGTLRSDLDRLVRHLRILAFLIERFEDDMRTLERGHLLALAVDSSEMSAYMDPSNQLQIERFLWHFEQDPRIRQPGSSHWQEVYNLQEKILLRLFFNKSEDHAEDKRILLPAHWEEFQGHFLSFQRAWLNNNVRNINQIYRDFLDFFADDDNYVTLKRFVDHSAGSAEPTDEKALFKEIVDVSPRLHDFLRASTEALHQKRGLPRLSQLLDSDISRLRHLSSFPWSEFNLTKVQVEALKESLSRVPAYEGPEYEAWLNFLQHHPSRLGNTDAANQIDADALAYLVRINRTLADIGAPLRLRLVTRAVTLLACALDILANPAPQDRALTEGASLLRHPRLYASATMLPQLQAAEEGGISPYRQLEAERINLIERAGELERDAEPYVSVTRLEEEKRSQADKWRSLEALLRRERVEEDDVAQITELLHKRGEAGHGRAAKLIEVLRHFDRERDDLGMLVFDCVHLVAHGFLMPRSAGRGYSSGAAVPARLVSTVNQLRKRVFVIVSNGPGPVEFSHQALAEIFQGGNYREEFYKNLRIFHDRPRVIPRERAGDWRTPALRERYERHMARALYELCQREVDAGRSVLRLCRYMDEDIGPWNYESYYLSARLARRAVSGRAACLDLAQDGIEWIQKAEKLRSDAIGSKADPRYRREHAAMLLELFLIGVREPERLTVPEYLGRHGSFSGQVSSRRDDRAVECRKLRDRVLHGAWALEEAKRLCRNALGPARRGEMDLVTEAQIYELLLCLMLAVGERPEGDLLDWRRAQLHEISNWRRGLGRALEGLRRQGWVEEELPFCARAIHLLSQYADRLSKTPVASSSDSAAASSAVEPDNAWSPLETEMTELAERIVNTDSIGRMICDYLRNPRRVAKQFSV